MRIRATLPTLFPALALCVLAACGGGRQAHPYPGAVAEARQAVQDIMASTQATAVSVALVDRRGVVWAEAFGEADTGVPATPATLFGVASVSKVPAAVSVLQLADQGRLSLEEPIAAYIPGFDMPLDPRHRDITVRMLLAHTSGLPGYDPRGGETLALSTDYAARMMEGLGTQRLKHDPGLLACYNNDGFSMVENLVKGVSGLDYPEYVRRNILTPLAMDASRYQVDPLPAGSYAEARQGSAKLPLRSYNVFATGGLFSTPTEMGRLAAMILRGGTDGSRRILSAASVEASGANQRLGGFDPAPCMLFAYGLGWDTVAHPAFAAVGVRAWQKGGDLENHYGANLEVLPDEGLGVVVLGASNSFNSTAAAKISERILLRALVDIGRIPAMPSALTGAARPAQALSQADKEALAGIYASNSDLYRVGFASDDSLVLEKFGTEWKVTASGMRLRDDGWFATDAKPFSGYRILARGGRSFLAVRDVYGYGHYQVQSLLAQRVDPAEPLSAAWQARAAEAWLPVTLDPAELLDGKEDPSLRFASVPGLEGYLKGPVLLRAFATPTDARLDGMFLTCPDGVRDLVDVETVTRGGETWLRTGTRLWRPRSTAPVLAPGAGTVTIGADGSAEWRAVPSAGTATVAGCTAWAVYGSDLKPLATGTGPGAPSLAGAAWIALLGAAGSTVTVNLQTP